MSGREEEQPEGQPWSEETQPAPETYTSEAEIAQLRQQLESKERDITNQQDKYLRICAEFENYKKRAARDQEELSKYANERLLKELLPVVDNLERAIVHTKNSEVSGKILEGLELILKQFLEVMGKLGVTGFESHLQPFDPTKHQAIGQMESDEHEEGTVIEEIQRGYRLNDRILRPALVMVSKKKNKEDTANPPQDAGDGR
jgi:molecular chaperone GrpE